MAEQEHAARPEDAAPPQGERPSSRDPDADARRARVRAIVAARMSVELPDSEVDLIDGGYLDSLTLIELLFELEREFDVRFSFDDLDLESFRTVDRITEFVGALQDRGAG